MCIHYMKSMTYQPRWLRCKPLCFQPLGKYGSKCCMSETLDPTESGRKAAAVASPELLMAGHPEMKRRSKRAVSAPSSLQREMLPEFPTKAPGSLVHSSLTLICSSEDTLQEPELWVTAFRPSPLTSTLDLLMTQPPSLPLKRRKSLSFISVEKHVFTLTENLDHLTISHSSFRKYNPRCDKEDLPERTGFD